MTHPIHTIRSVEVVGPHSLRLAFGDGLERTVDLTDVLAGALYGPLADPAFFARVALDPEAQTIAWPNGADFDPATLHDWPDHEREWKERAQRWRMATV